MISSTLSPQTLVVINSYENLKIGGKTINCPYFNNRASNLRGALRVSVGKGTPQEIVDEAQIIGLREKMDLNDLDEKTILKFLVDHHIGLDCSAFVYYVLNAELQTRKHTKLKSVLSFKSKNIFRRLVAKMRVVENTDVKIFDVNSKEIVLADLTPGDLIISIGGGIKHDYNHVMIITSTTKDDSGKLQVAEYMHSYHWKTEGKYTKGIRRGKIEIRKSDGTVLEQKWIENGKSAEENETWAYLKEAHTVRLSRLKV